MNEERESGAGKGETNLPETSATGRYKHADVTLGIREFVRGRFRAALPLLEPAAKEGHLKAQQMLARMYYAGRGVPVDREKHLYWLERAADNGDRSAKARLKKLRTANKDS